MFQYVILLGFNFFDNPRAAQENEKLLSLLASCQPLQPCQRGSAECVPHLAARTGVSQPAKAQIIDRVAVRAFHRLDPCCQLQVILPAQLVGDFLTAAVTVELDHVREAIHPSATSAFFFMRDRGLA